MSKMFLRVAACFGLILAASSALAEKYPGDPTAGGKYAELVGTLTCAKDEETYGAWKDYGFWKGGAWCGKRGPEGYWVFVAPTWYIWAVKYDGGQANSAKYGELIATLRCPKDVNTYGSYKDYGYWGGGAWCGQTGPAGYWVYIAPTWYIYARRNE